VPTDVALFSAFIGWSLIGRKKWLTVWNNFIVQVWIWTLNIKLWLPSVASLHIQTCTLLGKFLDSQHILLHGVHYMNCVFICCIFSWLTLYYVNVHSFLPSWWHAGDILNPLCKSTIGLWIGFIIPEVFFLRKSNFLCVFKKKSADCFR